MPFLQLNNTTLRYVDVRRETEAGVFTRLHLTCSFTQSLRDEFDWPELPDEASEMKLNHELVCNRLSLTPDATELVSVLQFEISCHDVGDFKVVRVQDKGGDSSRVELRFVVRSLKDGAAALAENWLRSIGDGAGTLRMDYVRQDNLPQQPGPAQDLLLTDDGRPILSGSATGKEQ